MIDIHSHILPAWDDGSRSLDESVRMLDLAASCGTTDIVATPHANSEFRFDEAVVRERFAELKAAAPAAIRVHLGCDFHLSYENVVDAVKNPRRYTINENNYLMVELPDLVVPDSARQIIKRLREVGVIPVITHPERNAQVQSKFETLQQWIEDGCLMQVTGQSLLGRFGSHAEKSALGLMDRGMVHFIASDAHDCDDRPPRLDLAFEFVSGRYGSECALRLFQTNPAAALTGEPIERQQAAFKRSWFAFWK